MPYKAYPPPGTPPGTLREGPERAAVPSRLNIIWYDKTELEEFSEGTVADCQKLAARAGFLWMHLTGVSNIELLQALGRFLDLHPLALEDVVEGRAPTKVEDYDSFLFMVTRLVQVGNGQTEEQISLFLGPRFLLSIQESDTDHFEIIRERLRHKQGLIRQSGVDYLAYTLLDYIVDSWFPVLETFGDRLEELEDRAIQRPDAKTMEQVQELRRSFFRLRRLIWPLRDALNTLLRGENQLITDHTRLYLRDCYDHAFQVVDLLENYREVTAGVVEVYLSSLSIRLNEIMKMLTVIATIFIPLTFITGLYGMNFSPEASPWNMPELRWRFGYLYALGVMLMVSGGLIIYFRRKKWL
ncbi:MAG: magnesium/cobalt transporter CorA [Desulfobacca sp.]|nr:magnesium/cobalt transporter CorA [Desulfobacca sp.]